MFDERFRSARKKQTCKKFVFGPPCIVVKVTYSFQIIFEGKKAVGVAFKHEGKVIEVRANNDVILSAGTIGTAKLLLLSGVGPRNHLQSLKVRFCCEITLT